MLTKTGRFALATAMLWLVFGVGGRAQADLTLTTPLGLSPGDTFRFVFVTDGSTTAHSSIIGDYNQFVTTDASNEAGGGVVTYGSTTLTWTAIASVAGTNAIDNITGSPSTPIYLANGTEVASSYTTSPGGIWSGTLLAPLNQNLDNVTRPAYVWS